MKEIIVAPSILALDYANVDKGLENVMNSKAKWLHFDVMDGHFVPNLTFGPDIMKGFKRKTNLFMDVHIMVDDPFFVSKMFIDAGADLVTFHYEALSSIDECLELVNYIHSRDILAGISIKPDTPIEKINAVLPFIDLALVMSVEPGFGGQKFNEATLDKMKYLDKMKRKFNYKYFIEVDGGINAVTGKKCVSAGANVLVAGSYVFNEDVSRQVESLICLG